MTRISRRSCARSSDYAHAGHHAGGECGGRCCYDRAEHVGGDQRIQSRPGRRYTHLGTRIRGWQLTASLDGLSVTVNGVPAYVYYVSPTQVNILTPPNAISGSVPVQVSDNGAISANFMVQAQAEAPSFFVFGGGPYIAATHANGSYLGPTSLYPGSTTPAQPGETITMYANGFGSTSTPVVSGPKRSRERYRQCR